MGGGGRLVKTPGDKKNGKKIKWWSSSSIYQVSFCSSFFSVDSIPFHYLTL